MTNNFVTLKMMRFLSLTSLILLSTAVFAGECKPITVAVIDTGFGHMGNGEGVKLCKYGHKDFSIEQEFTSRYGTIDRVPYDNHGHGTNVVGLVEKYAQPKVNYCIVVIKYYSDKQSGIQNLIAEEKAIEYANNIGVNIINNSGGGPTKSEKESTTVRAFLDRGGLFVSAAGNDGKNIDRQEFAYYPAVSDPRVIIVGNKNVFGVPSSTSNYGTAVKVWEFGNDQAAYGLTFSGTSQATAITTGKILSTTINKCDIGF